MTTFVKALNKIENLFIELGAKREDAQEAIEVLSEVYEEKLATKEDLKVLSTEIQTLKWFIASVWVGIIGLFIQNLVS